MKEVMELEKKYLVNQIFKSERESLVDELLETWERVISLCALVFTRMTCLLSVTIIIYPSDTGNHVLHLVC